jgi:hypothetical protein
VICFKYFISEVRRNSKDVCTGKSIQSAHELYTFLLPLHSPLLPYAVEAKTQNGTKSCGVILSFISIITAIGHIRKHIFFSSAKEGNRNIVCVGGWNSFRKTQKQNLFIPCSINSPPLLAIGRQGEKLVIK